MKKLIALAAVAAAMPLIAVESANVVGYQTYSGDWIQSIGTAFTPMNSTGTWVCDTKVFDTDAVASDNLMVFNPEKWDLDSYIFKGYDGEGHGLGWQYSTADIMTGDPIIDSVASFELGASQVAYFCPADGMSGVNVSGQVQDTTKVATVTFDDSNWIFEFVNPFPKATTLADLETFCVASDNLMVFNPEKWDLDSYIYIGPGSGWQYSTADIMTGDPIATIITDSSTVVLPAGKGGYFAPADTTGRTWNVSL